ncbi:hypothetical protein TAF16_0239 [Anoxybacillus flavithermus]|uniref:Uncharacterized protein n=1 Tax=Anoxybacillus flavithermus TaxID=33934 RepID=A0A178TMA8_9BACL|nr:hypothetical protein TAF16_0239 [Anoxybacillus flavithermus]
MTSRVHEIQGDGSKETVPRLHECEKRYESDPFHVGKGDNLRWRS